MTQKFPSRRSALTRRNVLALGGWAGAGLAGSAAAQPASAPQASEEVQTEKRLALLLGNREYPPPFDLPPIPKNVHDLKGVLEKRGFSVTDALDLDLAASKKAVDGFIAQAQAVPGATLFFYFSGHGVQVDAANLLLPAGLNPSAAGDVIRRGSFQLLEDVVGRLSSRKDALTIAVVDACRTSLRAGSDGGLNQVEAPPGCLIAFSTGAGKPAIAPAVETQNTFYTGSLVKLLASVSDETSFPDLFQLVKTDVRNTMQNHPVPAIRTLAQDPFIADHTKLQLTVAPRVAEQAAAPKRRFSGENEEADWAKLELATWPAEVVQLAEGYLQNYPSSKLVTGATVMRDGSRQAAKILQRSDVRLFRSAFQVKEDMDTDQQRDLHRAGRGDKDAAARLGRTYRGTGAGASRYEGWLQYAAALGNGIASYELAVYYRRQDQPVPASQFEARSRELGYTPPPTLDNVRK